MIKKTIINEQEFDNFLSWLDENKEIAGQKYETIRLSLIKIFLGRNCEIAEELADESIDRVIKKCDKLIGSYKGDPAYYCYGVAKKVYLEYTRRPKTQEFSETVIQKELKLEEDDDEQFLCLKKCLKKLDSKKRKLITKYYIGKNKNKVERRKKLEEEYGVSNQSLRVRVFRIRETLQKCILDCEKQY